LSNIFDNIQKNVQNTLDNEKQNMNKEIIIFINIVHFILIVK